MSEQVADSLKLKISHVSYQNQDSGAQGQAVKDGTGTQFVNQKVHLDCTPSLKGKEYPGNSPEGFHFVKEDGHSPVLEYQWWVDGKEASNSAEMPDPFNLGSYEDQDTGCTPAMKLLEAVGSSRHKVEMQGFIRAEYNGGKEVRSNKVSWYCD